MQVTLSPTDTNFADNLFQIERAQQNSLPYRPDSYDVETKDGSRIVAIGLRDSGSSLVLEALPHGEAITIAKETVSKIVLCWDE